MLVGLGFSTLLVGHYGFAAVGLALLAVGWAGLIAILLLRLVFVTLCGVAWGALLSPAERPSGWAFVWGRLIRDSGSELLPLSPLGGIVMGARAAILAGLPGTLAAASTIVDVTMELLGQSVFIVLGLAILSAPLSKTAYVATIVICLAGAVVMMGAFMALQHRGVAILELSASRLARQWVVAATKSAAAVQTVIHLLYGRRWRLLTGSLLHLICWVGSAVEPWLALKLMGTPLGFGPVLAIESLLCAVRSAAFAVPHSVGIQEGAYVVLGGLFGVGPEVALALSLLKRVRDTSLGLPALLVWQFMEGRRAWYLNAPQ
jgi:putative membrane protein